MNHLAIAAVDVAAAQRFYCAYFDFREGRAPGFLEGPQGFVLSIDALAEPPIAPSWLHHGFHLPSRSDLVALYERMKNDGVPIADELREQGPTVVFFCHDPSGLLVEVRAPRQ